jgi:hypothetical protein
MNALLIVALVLIAAGVVLFVLKGPDLGSGEGGGDSPNPLGSDGPPSMGGGDGGGAGMA